MTGAKPFDIPKREVWEAFKHVKANQGAAGVDGQSLQDFEVRLADNLYKLWNRLSSGSYMPPPVRRVDIPKANGGTRPLGIPTVADRIAQEVVRRYLEPLLEPLFHADSYGYRPKRSAIDAIRRWSLQTRSDKALDDLARMFNPYIRGWINYYSHFYKSALYPTLRRIDAFIIRWARRKFKRLRQRPRGARNWLARVIRSSPGLFVHWSLLYGQGRTLGAV